jgi:hypothetical protein
VKYPGPLIISLKSNSASLLDDSILISFLVFPKLLFTSSVVSSSSKSKDDFFFEFLLFPVLGFLSTSSFNSILIVVFLISILSPKIFSKLILTFFSFN